MKTFILFYFLYVNSFIFASNNTGDLPKFEFKITEQEFIYKISAENPILEVEKALDGEKDYPYSRIEQCDRIELLNKNNEVMYVYLYIRHHGSSSRFGQNRGITLPKDFESCIKARVRSEYFVFDMADKIAAIKEFPNTGPSLSYKVDTICSGAEKWESIFVEPNYVLNFSNINEIVKRFTRFTVGEYHCFTSEFALHTEKPDQVIEMQRADNK